MTETQTSVVVGVWTDVLCPWRYPGEERLGKAITQSDRPDADEVWGTRSDSTQEDCPDLVPAIAVPLGQHGIPMEQSRQMQEGMVACVAREGLAYSVDHLAGNTLDMLRG